MLCLYPGSKHFPKNFRKTRKSPLCLYSEVVLLMGRAHGRAGERAARPDFENCIANFLFLFVRYVVAYDFECGRGSNFVFLLQSCLFVSLLSNLCLCFRSPLFCVTRISGLLLLLFIAARESYLN
jgi:hypothetical protein